MWIKKLNLSWYKRLVILIDTMRVGNVRNLLSLNCLCLHLRWELRRKVLRFLNFWVQIRLCNHLNRLMDFFRIYRTVGNYQWWDTTIPRISNLITFRLLIHGNILLGIPWWHSKINYLWLLPLGFLPHIILLLELNRFLVEFILTFKGKPSLIRLITRGISWVCVRELWLRGFHRILRRVLSFDGQNTWLGNLLHNLLRTSALWLL